MPHKLVTTFFCLFISYTVVAMDGQSRFAADSESSDERKQIAAYLHGHPLSKLALQQRINPSTLSVNSSTLPILWK